MSPKCIIGFLGPTGSGKSSLIQSITGRKDIHIGHGLESDTSEIIAYEFNHRGTRFILVDTPGFDDSHGLDRLNVMKLLRWLKNSAHEGAYFNGLVYLQRIIDPRFSGTAESNLRLFERLCGEENLRNVILVTTFWGQVSPSLGDQREKQFISSEACWKLMIDQGAKVRRIDGSRASGLSIISEVAAHNQAFKMSAQKEMARGVDPTQTQAAQFINNDIFNLQKAHEASLAQLRAERMAREQYQQQKRDSLISKERAYQAQSEKLLKQERLRYAEELRRYDEQQEMKRRLREQERLRVQSSRSSRPSYSEAASAYSSEHSRFGGRSDKMTLCKVM